MNTQTEAVDACIQIVKSFKGKATKERRARGMRLSEMNSDAVNAIESEERGGDIVVEEICKALEVFKAKGQP